MVGANFTVANDVYNFDEDTGTHVLDVLTNDTTQSGCGVNHYSSSVAIAVAER